MFKSMRAKILGSGLALKRGFGPGAGANTNIAITGIKIGDVLLSVYELASPTDAVANAVTSDRTALAKITAAGIIQINAVTTGHQVDVLWASI